MSLKHCMTLGTVGFFVQKQFPGYTCEKFGQRYAVRYHVRRPDVDGRWLTVELQLGWTTNGPFNSYRVVDLKQPKMDVYVWTRKFLSAVAL